jgi:hypothetical protein
MPRRKKTETSVDSSVTVSDVKIDNSLGPSLFSRDENGLLKNIQYHFNEDGSVNWRSMIREEYLFPNKSWFELRKKDVPRSIEGLKDHQLLIKLAGIKELAKLRGFNHISYYTEKCELNHVAINCTVGFIGNYETGGESISFQDMANATLDNTSSFATKFLETIACNRAFVRCVRNFLNVHIVGDDEIDKSDNCPAQSQQSEMGPVGVLKKVLKEKHSITEYEMFKNLLREVHKQGKVDSISIETIKSWNDFADISAKDARILVGIIKN